MNHARQQIRPILVVAAALLLVAIVWRHTRADTSSDGRGKQRFASHAVGGARIELPARWRTISRAKEHATWGDAAGAHAVTLGSTESGEGSLAQIARQLVNSVAEIAHGARVVGEPELLDLPHGGRSDAAMLIRFEVPTSASTRTRLIQVWSREQRSRQDVVATWTSTDGHWPVDPTRHLPTSTLR
ncbi:MAG: hypothetical protein JWN41_1074 [Thermoleophilia bacterium]|nr:hypothetical protein [Thermoleophilia bacterium]